MYKTEFVKRLLRCLRLFSAPCASRDGGPPEPSDVPGSTENRILSSSSSVVAPLLRPSGRSVRYTMAGHLYRNFFVDLGSSDYIVGHQLLILEYKFSARIA